MWGLVACIAKLLAGQVACTPVTMHLCLAEHVPEAVSAVLAFQEALSRGGNLRFCSHVGAAVRGMAWHGKC